MRAFRIVLGVIAAVCGVLLCARAGFGPFHLGIAVNRPLNLQSIFGLAATLALLCGAKPAFETETRQPVDWRFASLPVLIAILAYWPNLYSPFLSDDFYLLTIAGDVSVYRSEVLVHGGGSEFFRPVGGLLLLLTRWAAGVDPFWWRLVSVLLHAANSLLVFLLAGSLFRRRDAAIIAAILFSIHGVTPEAVAWMAGRFDAIATFFVLSGLFAYTVYHRTQSAGPWYGSLFLMLLAVLTKESAYIFPALLTAAVSILPGATAKDLRATWSFWAVALAAFLLRWTVLGGIGGYGMSFNVLGILKALALRIWGAFYVPVNWSVEPSLSLSTLLALSLVAVVCLAFSVRADRKVILFSVGICLISCVPPLQQLLIDTDLQKSRLLYLPLVGFCFLTGLAVSAVRTQSLKIAAAAAMLAFHAGALRHNLDIWNDVATRADDVCAGVLRQLPPSVQTIEIAGLPGSLNGVYFLRNGLSGCLDLKAGRPLQVRVTETDKPGVTGADTLVLHWNTGSQSLQKRQP